MSTGQQSPEPGQMRWQFIDSSKDNADKLTQVKRHVMHEYMRQKRLETQQREGTTESSAGDEPELPVRKSQSNRENRQTGCGSEDSGRREPRD
jgi:hypothetical protein